MPLNADVGVRVPSHTQQGIQIAVTSSWPCKDFDGDSWRVQIANSEVIRSAAQCEQDCNWKNCWFIATSARLRGWGFADLWHRTYWSIITKHYDDGLTLLLPGIEMRALEQSHQFYQLKNIKTTFIGYGFIAKSSSGSIQQQPDRMIDCRQALQLSI